MGLAFSFIFSRSYTFQQGSDTETLPDQYTRINDEQLIGQLGGFGENGTPDIADSTGNGNNNPLEEFANHTGGTQTSADWLLEQAGSEIPETTKDDVVQVNPVQDLDLPLVLLSEDGGGGCCYKGTSGYEKYPLYPRQHRGQI